MERVEEDPKADYVKQKKPDTSIAPFYSVENLNHFLLQTSHTYIHTAHLSSTPKRILSCAHMPSRGNGLSILPEVTWVCGFHHW